MAKKKSRRSSKPPVRRSDATTRPATASSQADRPTAAVQTDEVAASKKAAETKIAADKQTTSTSSHPDSRTDRGLLAGRQKDKKTGGSGSRPAPKAKPRDAKKSTKKPNIFQRAIEYFKAVRLEIKRTTWPTRGEVLNMSIIVIFALIFFGLFIFIIDQIMVMLLQLYGQAFPDTDALTSAVSVDGVDGASGEVTGDADITSETDVTTDADTASDANSAGDAATGDSASASDYTEEGQQ